MQGQGDWDRFQMTSMAYKDLKQSLRKELLGIRRCNHPMLFLKNTRNDERWNIIKIITTDLLNF